MILGSHPDFQSTVYNCSECGLTQSSFVNRLYIKRYYEKRYREQRNENLTDSYVRFQEERATAQYKFINEINIKSSKNNNILEIGCGIASLLSKFKSQGCLFGCEDDNSMKSYLGNKIDISLLSEDEIFNSKRKFSLILMSHVFEHINDPLTYLDNLHKILLPNGYVFIEVPNEPLKLVTNQLENKTQGIGHLFNYTPETLKELILSSKKYEITKLEVFGPSVIEYIYDGFNGERYRELIDKKNDNGLNIRCLLRKRKVNNSKRSSEINESLIHGMFHKQIKMESYISELSEGIKLYDELLNNLEDKSNDLKDQLNKLQKIING